MKTVTRALVATLAPLSTVAVLAVVPTSAQAAPVVTTAPATPLAAASAADGLAREPALGISPRTFVGGQLLTWTGDLGVTGRRSIHLQLNMGRPGDTWNDVEGTQRTTDADGSFDFTYLAPSMFNIRYRVIGDGHATPPVLFNAYSQDLTLTSPSRPVPGKAFPLVVDTTPELARRPDVPGPVFPGRTLTLQKRVLTPESALGYANTWQNVATTRTDADGMGRFTPTVDRPGTVVYRVRQENWNADGNRIGWFPSFPTPVSVRTAADWRTQPSARATPAAMTTSTVPDPALRPGPTHSAGTNSSSTFGWGQSLFDFAWNYGQSLSDGPYRGSRMGGWWMDTTAGAGRVSLHNGGLTLDSQRDNVDGPGDVGTTRATLRENASPYGRWEVRLRMKSTENTTRDYRTLVQLVPEKASDYACGAHNITIAALKAHDSAIRFSARSAEQGKRWVGTANDLKFLDQTHHFGVEVAPGHVSWFLDGRAIGSVPSAAASPDVPMTVRLSMVGKGTQEMNRTQAIADWVRGFSLAPGRQVSDGPAMTTHRYHAGC